MEKMKEAYDEIFLNSEARYIIPAIRYLVTLVKIRDAATASYDKLCNIEFPFVQTEREYPLCVINMAKEYQAACYAEVYAAEEKLRKVIKEEFSRTVDIQKKLLGFEFDFSTETICKIISELEIDKFDTFATYTDEDIVKRFVSVMSIYDWDINEYDDDYEFKECLPTYDDDDDMFLTVESTELAIETVEEYLASLREQLAELKAEKQTDEKTTEEDEK